MVGYRMPNQKTEQQKCERAFTCDLCQRVSAGYGNNARPLSDGVCCDSCNANVVMARIYLTRIERVVKNHNASM